MLKSVVDNICPIDINSLPNNKILDWLKCKEIADDKENRAQIVGFVS